MQRCESIAEQQHHCRAVAETKGRRITPALEFSDHAISGTILAPEGFQAMLDAAHAGRFNVLYVYNLARLARESVIGMPTLKNLVYNCGVRVISTTEGLDTDSEGWEILATILCLHHEQHIKTLSADVRRGQRHNRRNEYSNGDYVLGYTSIVAPGQEHLVGHKSLKPRKIIVIDDQTKWVVESIFHWFVVQRRSIQWIVRELNRRKAPKDHRSSNPRWYRNNVLTVLSNPKYCGVWPWAQTKVVRNPNTGVKRQVPTLEEEREEFLWIRNDLAISDPEIFAQAEELLKEHQKRVASQRKENGTLGGSSKGYFGRRRQHLLQGLLICPECKEALYSGGSKGRYKLFCHNARSGACSCTRQLDRDLAERLITRRIAGVLLEDSLARDRVLQQP